MSKSMTDAQLQLQIEQLSTEIEPSRELWTGIERAIEHKAQYQEFKSQNDTAKAFDIKPFAIAASMVFMVLATWFVSSPSQLPSNTTIELTAVEALQQDYQQQKETMLVSFGKPDLSQLPEPMQKQFKELSDARASLMSALENDPNNANLLNLLKWTQNQELSLIEQLYSPKWQSI